MTLIRYKLDNMPANRAVISSVAESLSERQHRQSQEAIKAAEHRLDAAKRYHQARQYGRVATELLWIPTYVASFIEEADAAAHWGALALADSLIEKDPS